VSLAQVRVAWLLIPFLPRVSDVMLNLCRLMRGNFLIKWRSPMSIISMASHLLYLLIRKELRIILVRRWERSPRFTTICACSTRVLDIHIALNVDVRQADRLYSKLSMLFSICQRVRASCCLRHLFQGAKVSTKVSSRICDVLVTCVYVWMARYTI